jgi:hypothetical protein
MRTFYLRYPARRTRTGTFQPVKTRTCRLVLAESVDVGIVTQFYGMREFAIEDPDGYVITFAERIG